MSFKIEFTPLFERELRRLSKKHTSLKKDISNLILTLEKEPTQGEALGKNCFKVRMAISSKNKGKSGGARIITHIRIVDEMIFLISIYDKSEADTISDTEILSRIKDL